jgi:hypothetical protein
VNRRNAHDNDSKVDLGLEVQKMLVEKKKHEIEELKKVDKAEYKKKLRAMGIITTKSNDSRNSGITSKSKASRMSRNTSKTAKE